MHEPTTTALVLAVTGLLVGVSALMSRPSGRVGIPLALVFLGLGVLAGSEGIGGIVFEDYGLAFRIGTTALVLILFDGGLNTSLQSVRTAVAPAAVLSTVAVLGTATLVALVGMLLGLSWRMAFLLGAVVSSTDAAAVFAVLRGSGLRLNRRLATIMELESGSNDPMAFALTTFLAGVAAGQRELDWSLAWVVPLQLAVGLVGGVLVGLIARIVLRSLRLPAGGLFPVLSVAFALVAFGLPTLVYGSGFLAVYVAGVVLGNGRIPFRGGIARVHDALAWLAQVGMFLMLGLLVFPSRIAEMWLPGTLVALFLAFVARPAMVFLCLLPFRVPLVETLYLGWVGLRGAVPIVLATFPILLDVPNAHDLFDLVFFVVVVNTLLPGATVRWLTRKLKLESVEPRPSPAVVEINAAADLGGEILWFLVEAPSAVCGSRLAEVPFPEGALAVLLVRDEKLVGPRGTTELKAGDYVCVFAQPEDRPVLELVFGAPV